MFTGIIQGLGEVLESDGNATAGSHRPKTSPSRCLWIETPFRRVRRGESISVDGVCLTVARVRGRRLGFDVGRETRRITTLGQLTAGGKVNLERALRVGDRLGGHWVSGHVEGIGQVAKVERFRSSWLYTIRIPKGLCRYVVPKGSLAVDGISLTVADIKGPDVKIMIIPHTRRHTTLGAKHPGAHVNLEPDLLAKYAERAS